MRLLRAGRSWTPARTQKGDGIFAWGTQTALDQARRVADERPEEGSQSCLRRWWFSYSTSIGREGRRPLPLCADPNARRLKREVQEEAFYKGLIPYIPDRPQAFKDEDE
jgi:hypothetical protein